MIRQREYQEAFAKCYPQTKIETRIKRDGGEPKMAVAIDGTWGDRLLSKEEVDSAIVDFLRGKIK